MERLRGDSADSDCATVFDYYFVDFGVALEVEVLVDRTGRVDVAVGGVTSSSGLGMLVGGMRGGGSMHVCLTSRLIHLSQCSAPLSLVSSCMRSTLQGGHGLLSGNQILEIISRWNTLRLSCPQEIRHDRIRIISERDLDWTLITMKIP